LDFILIFELLISDLSASTTKSYHKSFKSISGAVRELNNFEILHFTGQYIFFTEYCMTGAIKDWTFIFALSDLCHITQSIVNFFSIRS
jgi:hypothetical protein